MPVLSGVIADVTNTPITADDLVELFVKVPAPRVSGSGTDQIITMTTVTVDVDPVNGSFSVNLDPGVAILVVRTFQSHDTFNLAVRENMTTIREAIIEEIGALPELEASELVALAAQVRADHNRVRDWHDAVEDWYPVIEGWHGDVDGWQAQVAEDRQIAHDASVSATASAGAAAASAADAASSEQAAAQSASGAATSASEASDSSTAASVDRQTVQSIRDNLQALLDDSEAWAGFEEAIAQLEPRMAAEVNKLKGDAPEVFDTLGEVAAWIADHSDEASAMLQSIAERARKTYVDEQLSGKADKGAENTAQWTQVSGKPATFPPDAHTHTKADVGLGNVDNTSDASKPVSTATATALAGKANTSHTHAEYVAKAGTTTTLWAGTQAAYDALPAATKNAAGFIAVIS